MSDRIKSAIAEFRRCYSAMLIAADQVRDEIEREAVGFEALPYEMTRIIQLVCDTYQVKPAQILSRARDAHLARARFVVLTLASQFTPFTHAAIAGFLHRDHAMVGHARDVIAAAESTDARFAETLANLRIQLSKVTPLTRAA